MSTSNADLTADLQNYEYRVIDFGVSPTSYNPITLENDWFVGVLRSSFYTPHYLFNCYSIDSSILWEYTSAVGYPSTYSMNMKKSHGKVIEYNENDTHIITSNRIEPGMSGGPIYAEVGGRSCIAIISGIDSDGYCNAIRMTDDMVDIICDTIINY